MRICVVISIYTTKMRCRHYNHIAKKKLQIICSTKVMISNVKIKTLYSETNKGTTYKKNCNRTIFITE